MTGPEGPRSTATGAKMSTVELARLAGQLTPRQLQDEFSLALLELKGKGVKVGVAAGILLVAVVFLVSMAISILVAAIMGLALVMPAWLAALIVAAVFLVVGAILGLIGYSAMKRTMPLLPAEAIHGVRYDVGVLREGSSFDPATLEEKPEKAAKPEKAEREEPKPPAPTMDELRARTSERRDHLASPQGRSRPPGRPPSPGGAGQGPREACGRCRHRAAGSQCGLSRRGRPGVEGALEAAGNAGSLADGARRHAPAVAA